MNNQANTAQGTNVEHLFAKSIFNNQQAWHAILKSINAEIAIGKEGFAEVVGRVKRKTDVVINFKNNTDIAPIRANIKSFSAAAGYNQLGRRNLPAFCKQNMIKKSDQDFLEFLWLRKARNGGILVKTEERERVERIFTGFDPGISAMLGDDHPQIFVLYLMDKRQYNLYNIATQVLPVIRNQGVTFTKKSSNIEIGNYIVIQRKGSAAGESGKDPYHISHGSNHIQFKMRVKKFWNDIEPISSYQL